jgi:hypothetical protein
MAFETLDPAHLTGSISLTVLDPGAQPTNIIETDDNWSVKVEWSISGPIAPGLGGDWHVKAFLDDLDGGPFEGQVGATKHISLNSAAPALVRNYTTTIDVPAGTPPVGVYRLVTVITYSNLNVPLEMAAFEEGPVLQFYNPGPIETF